MSKLPYPGTSPNYTAVDKLGGFHRTCIVIDLLSLEQLNPGELAVLQEKLEATIENVRNQNIEKADVVLPDRFDIILKKGLRIS